MSKEVHLMWDDSVLTIAPSSPALEKFLTYREKKLAQDPKCPWKKVTKVTVNTLYKVINQQNGYNVIQTMQGMWLKVKTFLEENGWDVKFYDMRIGFPKPRLDLMCGFRFKQQELLTSFLSTNCSGLLGAPTRYGKCLGKNTKVLMFDGTVKFVQDIRDGDLVMGHDSKPRKVVGVVSGIDDLYRVTPNKGESFVCTGDHKLLVYRTKQGGNKSPNLDGKEFIITAQQYHTQSKTFKHLHKLVRRAVSYPEKKVDVDPYCYGLWLGDGHTSAPILTSADEICAKAWMIEADKVGLVVSKKEIKNNKASYYSVRSKNKSILNIWRHTFKSSVVNKCKTLLPVYAVNSRDVRLQVLAGLIDSDGCVNNPRPGLGVGCYSITTKLFNLANDIASLCRGLGFRATVKERSKCAQSKIIRTYYDVNISGNLSDIPVKLHRKKAINKNLRVNPLITGFTTEYLCRGDYYGFELEGPDGLFLLGDYTVTHNTTLIKNTLRAFPNVHTVVTAPGADLVKQLYEDVKEALPHREVKLIGAGSTKSPCDDINVVSMDSLHKCDASACKLLLIDEPHACVTDSRLPELTKFDKARRIGFGATLKGRFDQRDILIEALIGPVIAERTFQEAVAEGAVCPLIVYMIVIPLAGNADDRDRAYKTHLFKGERVAKAVRWICHELLPQEWQTLLFIKNEEQAEYFLDWVGQDGTIAMAKRMTKTEREELMERMRGDEIKRCLASEIYAQGVTFNHVRALINLSGGGANTSTIQKPGRLAEVRPNKKCGVVFDFLFIPGSGTGNGIQALYRESMARVKAYTEKGYEIIYVNSYNELETSFKSKAI
jgi:hypothetical protein